MGCCQSSEPGEDERLLGENNGAAPAPAAANPAEGASYQGVAPSGGLFQQGAAPQLATMQDEVQGDAVIGEEQKVEDSAAAEEEKQEDSKSAAVINETQKKLIDLTGNEEEEDVAVNDAPKMNGSIRVGAVESLIALPTGPAKDTSASAAVPVGDADDDDLDLTGASVPVSKEGDLARRMGSSLAADVHSVAAQPAADAKDVVKPLGEVKEADEPKEEVKEVKEEVKEVKAEDAPAEPQATD